MKLYVCYGTFTVALRPGGHPCGNAYKALKEAGYEPEVIRSYGLGMLPDFLNQTPGRREVKRLTGNNWVPALVTDDETVIQGSHEIIDWAKANPAGAEGTAAGAEAASAGGGGGAAGEAGESAGAEGASAGAEGASSGGPAEGAGAEGQAEPS
jgi:hypothetical protein